MTSRPYLFKSTGSTLTLWHEAATHFNAVTKQMGYAFYLGVLITKGFCPTTLGDHFRKHVTLRREFLATTMYDYESLADKFMSSPLTATMRQCKRVGGDIVRYDSATDEFGILDSTGVIRSYYRPDPKRHGEKTNLDYWKRECNRIF